MTRVLQLRELEGKYEIIRKLREGGMGAVYLVRHRLLEELRVVKVMRAQFEADSEMRQRFLREAKSAIHLRHPNIAQLYDFSIDDEGTGYIVMEFIDGVTFEQIIARRPLPGVALVLEVATQGLRALSFLHRKGFVHRDIAPDNLMLTRDPEGEPLVKLIDLGIAKTVAGEGRLTMSGSFLGKLRYASPEAFQPGPDGEGVGPRSDLYSFGIVLYELLSGTHPIPGKDTQSLLAGHLINPPTPFEQTDPEHRISPRLRAAVYKALAKRAGDRFASADEFARELLQVEAEIGRGQGREFEITRILEGSGAAAPPTSRPAVGSTQERLNRQFFPSSTPAPSAVIAPTPTPAQPPAPPPPSPPIPIGPPFHAGADVASQVLERDGIEAATVREIPRKVDSSAAREALEREAAQARAALEEALVDSDWALAGRLLSDSATRFGEIAWIVELRGRLANGIDSELGARIEEGERALAEGDPDGALAAAEAALRLRPFEARSVSLRDRSLAEKTRREQAALREQSRQRALRAVETELRAGRLAAGEAALAALRAEHGDSPEAGRLAEQLAAARAAAARRRGLELVEQAERLERQGKLEAAAAKLAEASALAPGVTVVESARRRIEAARWEVEQQALRARELATALGEAEASASAGDWAAVQAALDRVLPLLDVGGSAAAERVRKLNARREEAARAARLAEARRLFGIGELVDAEHLLRDGLAQVPAWPEAQALLAEVVATLERQRAERARLEALTEACERLSGLLRRGDLERAERELGAALARFGEVEALLVLRAQIEAARREQSEKARLQALEAERGKIEALLRRGEAAHAERELEAALGRFGEVAPLTALRAQVESVRRAQAEKVRLEALAEACQRIEASLRRGDLDRSEGELEAALGRFGEVERLLGLRREIQTTRKERGERAEVERREALEREVAAVRIDLASGRVDEAARAIQSLTSRHHGWATFEGILPKLVNELGVARSEAAERMLIEAVALLDDGRLDEAVARAEAAERLAPGLPRAAQLHRDAARAREERAATERRTAQARQELEKLRRSLSRGDLAKARSGCDRLLRELGELPELTRFATELSRAEEAATRELAAAGTQAPPVRAATPVAAPPSLPTPPPAAAPPEPAVHRAAEWAPVSTVERAEASPSRARLIGFASAAAAVLAIVIWLLLRGHTPPSPLEGTTPTATSVPPVVAIEPTPSTAADGPLVDTPSPTPGVVPPLVAAAALALDARPWAELVAISRADGTSLPLPASPFTPLLLELPAGNYRLSLRNRELGVTRELALTLREGERISRSVDLGAPGVDEYLRKAGW